jgi:hypothetical protein
MADAIETVLDRIEQQRVQRIIPKDIGALQLLQMEYRGEIELTHNQRRSAIACLQHESPKFGVIATITNVDDFASMLDRAIQRSQVRLIEHRPEEKPAPPPIAPHGTERVGPTPDRRFRRG